jgi:hypothetical protein
MRMQWINLCEEMTAFGGGDTVEHDGQEIVEENILLYDLLHVLQSVHHFSPYFLISLAQSSYLYLLLELCV